MRGKVTGLFFYQVPVGITPAYAGKSKNTCTSVVFDQDHPRVCGEKVPAIRRFAQIMGSPPRMRGKGHRIPLRHPLQGITPAYAGKSSACRRTLSAGWDHPRICGEKAEMGGFIPRFSGSPPRMRGKGTCNQVDTRRQGITPAYAGKSLSFVSPATAPTGSPPRMRGKVELIKLIMFALGITPAYAGKSLGRLTPLFTLRDHPRVCGEKYGLAVGDKVVLGSPPRMRGKALGQRKHGRLVRITPAYAGKSSRRSPGLCSRTDHPRVCGEKCYMSQSLSVFRGSPPRMRGKDKWWTTQQLNMGITPAYAGKRQEPTQ